MLQTLALLGTLALAPGSTEALPPERAEVEPKRFRLRTGSLEIGVGWRPTLSSYLDEPLPCGYNIACGVTPRIGFDFELGSRSARLVLGSYHAPIPLFNGDLAVIEAFIVEAGALFGGPRFRAGVVGGGGAATNFGGALIVRASPWIDRRGHRHGLDLRISTSWFQPLGIALSYRWYPRKLDRAYPAR